MKLRRESEMAVHKPSWFSNDYVMVSTAPTCGLTKGGRLLRKVDPKTAQRVQTVDPETGGQVDAVNDQLLDDMQALSAWDGATRDQPLTDTLNFIPAEKVSLSCAVPAYYDHRFFDAFQTSLKQEPMFSGFSSATLGELLQDKRLLIRGGHGSPSQEQRIGEVPYIKVSDLRAGFVNINPTNRVPRRVAERFWRGPSSKLQAFDLVCPERTSKNIGDFCVLMPGQEQVVVTKEIIVLRPGSSANFDTFYLLWAMTLKVVRDQWKRVIFMQTNREDVGKRYLEIAIPIPPSRERADEISQPFRSYYEAVAKARSALQGYLAASNAHHFFVSGAEETAEANAPELDDAPDESLSDSDPDAD
jgi:type I restriction enzyme M protein